MYTLRLNIDSNHIDEDQLAKASEIMQNGGLVAFPTETVYGLGGDALSKDASQKIYAAKGRPSDNPLIVHIADFSQLESIVAEVPDSARKLNEVFWPGPLTMIVRKNDRVPYETTGGLDTVAVRMPSHPIARRFIQQSGCMIAAPSANLSGRPSPTTAEHVWQDLNGRIDCIIDGGPVDIGLESTIIDLSEEVPMVLRPGYITLEQLGQVLGEVRMDPGILSEDSNVRPKAPGMRYRHYAPKGDLTIVSGPQELVVEKINELTRQAKEKGQSVGVIATTETKGSYIADTILTIGNRSDEESIAHNLYGILREFDDLGTEVMYSESFSTPIMGQAIMNRLLKAAGHQIIEV